MKSYIYLLFVASLLICPRISAQEKRMPQDDSEKINVLNVVLDSWQFDSLYPFDRVYFKSNELLKKDILKKLERNNLKVRVFNESFLTSRRKNYISLADYSMIENELPHVRIQLYSNYRNKTLNLFLNKVNQHWVIVNFDFMDE